MRGRRAARADVEPQSKVKDRIALAVLLALAVGCMVPAVMAEFVWDDIYLTRSKTVPQLGGLIDIWLSPKSHQPEIHFWPVTYSSFWLEYRLWGFHPAGYHVVNLILHAGISVLVWTVLRELDIPGAWLAAAIFAVHPVHVEPAAWVIGRKDLLAAMFYLVALLLWIRIALTSAPRRRLTLAMSVIAYGFAILAKTTAVTLPAILLIIHWWKRGGTLRSVPMSLLPFCLVGALLAGGETYYYHAQGEVGIDLTVPERLIVASKAMFFYVGKLIVPINLTNIYPLWDIDVTKLLQWAYPASLLGLIVTLALTTDRIGRGPLAAALIFLTALIPVSGLFNSSFMLFSYVADRYQYLASIAIIALLVAVGSRASAHRSRLVRRGGAALAALIIASLAVLSWRQTLHYQDDITFFRHVLDHNPEARTANYLLGKALSAAGRHEDALPYSLIGAERLPDNFTPNLIAGLTLFNLQRRSESLPYLERASRLRDDSESLREALTFIASGGAQFRGEVATIGERLDAAHALLLLGETDRARDEIGQSRPLIMNDDDRLRASILRAKVDFAQERYGQAERRLRRITARLDDIDLLLHLALSHYHQGKFADAIKSFEQLLARDPEHVVALVTLGESLRGAKQASEAMRVFERVLELDPYNETALIRLRDGG